MSQTSPLTTLAYTLTVWVNRAIGIPIIDTTRWSIRIHEGEAAGLIGGGGMVVPPASPMRGIGSEARLTWTTITLHRPFRPVSSPVLLPLTALHQPTAPTCRFIVSTVLAALYRSA